MSLAQRQCAAVGAWDFSAFRDHLTPLVRSDNQRVGLCGMAYNAVLPQRPSGEWT